MLVVRVDGAQLVAGLSRFQDKASKFAGPIDVMKQIARSEGLLGTAISPAFC